MKIIEYEDKYLEDVRDLLVELEEYLISIDQDNLDQIHPEYRDKMAEIDLQEVKDNNGSVSVTVNGKNVYVDSWNGSWSKAYTLTEGENTFDVVATNENGKKTKKSITVTYTVGAPKLVINQGDQTVTDEEFTLSGKATDDNYSVSVTVNGKNVYVDSWNGNWSKTYTLTEGENNFDVVAKNENGKQTKKSIMVTLTIGDPEIKFINLSKSLIFFNSGT